MHTEEDENAIRKNGKQHKLQTSEEVKLNFFENPVTSDRFEYASEPLLIKVVQEK